MHTAICTAHDEQLSLEGELLQPLASPCGCKSSTVDAVAGMISAGQRVGCHEVTGPSASFMWGGPVWWSS